MCSLPLLFSFTCIERDFWSQRQQQQPLCNETTNLGKLPINIISFNERHRRRKRKIASCPDILNTFYVSLCVIYSIKTGRKKIFTTVGSKRTQCCLFNQLQFWLLFIWFIILLFSWRWNLYIWMTLDSILTASHVGITSPWGAHSTIAIGCKW